MQYIAQCKVAVNGQSITDFKSVTIKEIEVRKPVNLMGKTGFIKVTPRHEVTLDYIVPANKIEFDFSLVENGTITCTYEDGSKDAYIGVFTLKVGEKKSDGDNEQTRQIQFGCENKI